MQVKDLYIFNKNNHDCYSLYPPENPEISYSQGFFLIADKDKMLTWDNKNFYITAYITNPNDYWYKDWIELDLDINKFILLSEQEDI